MPVGVAQLGYRVGAAVAESDEGLDCQPALLCAVRAVLRAAFSWSRITSAVPSQRISGDRQHSTGLWLSVPDMALRDSSDVLLCGHEAFPFAVEHGEDG